MSVLCIEPGSHVIAAVVLAALYAGACNTIPDNNTVTGTVKILFDLGYVICPLPYVLNNGNCAVFCDPPWTANTAFTSCNDGYLNDFFAACGP